jgi:hypothetical protein
MRRLTQILSLGVLLLVVSIGQISAQKCKFDYEKKDQITGEVTKKSTFAIIATVPFYTIERPLKWKLDINRVGNKYCIGVFLDLAGSVRNPITPESTLIFKLANGEIITLYANDTYFSTSHIIQDSKVVSLYDAKYDISEEDMQKMAASPIVYVKMGVGGRDYDYEFKDKKGADFQNKANCILQ